MSEVMEDWVWLLCPEEEHQRILDAPYAQYGAPKLALAGQLLDLNISLEPYEQRMAERMAQGLHCNPGCGEGCGR